MSAACHQCCLGLMPKPTPGSRQLPQITDPYRLWVKDKPLCKTPAKKRAEEKHRIAANKSTVHTKAANTSIANTAERQEVNWDTNVAHHLVFFSYEDLYSKFVPNTKNKAWFRPAFLRVLAGICSTPLPSKDGFPDAM
ncbi:hypothetical protein B0H19DRAFT_1063556 [Mycena capillaripes]|nr:hypothetical protein B0H19DRAFT_1063556 [Mycena capillaripes]